MTDSPNPILEQELPRMSTSDIKFLIRINKPKLPELQRQYEVKKYSVDILEAELQRRI